MRQIDADELFQKALGIIKDDLCYKELGILNMIAIAETVEAEPAKHGKWIRSSGNKYPVYTCSECSYDNNMEMPYCANCGTKMKGVMKYELKPDVMKWIPCCERLPESEESEILCLVTYQDYDISEGKWENVRLGIMSYLTKHQIWNTKALVKVLAWMQLPEPYKENKNND
ncbi:MAG: DUF551 domain-containing protein [Ruminococcus sp.]|nr:DUF551 domain-containing protein [Ruminococcus sp.]